MHRLTDFHHYVVCKVGKEVDSAGAAVEKADTHIYRAYPTGNILNLDCAVAVKKVACAYVKLYLGKRVVLFGRVKLGEKKLSAGDGSKLSCHSVMAPEVRAVGKRLIIYLEDYIVNIVNALDIGTEGDIVYYLPKSRVIVADSELSLRAAHTVRGKAGDSSRSYLMTAYRAAVGSEGNLHSLSYVGRTANDVNYARARVNLKKMKLL